MRRLAAALKSIDGRKYDPHKGELVERDWDDAVLASDKTWFLGTSAGRLDLVFEPSGTGGYADLARSAVEMQIEDVRVRIASLEDVIRSKEAADRPRDREQLRLLRRLLDRPGGE